MPKPKRYIAALLALLLGVLALTGCGQQDGDRFTLRVALNAPVETLDPAMQTDEDAASVVFALFENLMRMENDGEGGARLVPGIAKEYKVTTDYDGTVTYRFTLRTGARWSDGERVKAGDFVYAWRRLADPRTGSPNHALLSMVKGYAEVREQGNANLLAVSAENDRTFRVTLSEPCACFLEEVCAAPATMPLRRTSVISNTGSWAQGTDVLTNGPYRPEEWAAGEYLRLVRNEEYYGARPASPDELCFLFADGADDALARWQAGEADCVTALSAAAAAEMAEDCAAVPLRTTCCVLYSRLSDMFSDTRVREAFDLAIDRATAAEAIGAGAQGASGLVPYGVPNGTEDVQEDFRTVGGALCQTDAEGYPERCAEAVERLDGAGFVHADGFPPVELLCLSGSADRAAADALAEMWHSHLGVAVTVTELPQEELDERLRSGEYDLALARYAAPYGDAMRYLERFAGVDGNNELHYASGIFDLLIRVTRASEDPAARSAFLHDAEALLIEDTALSPVCFGARCELVRHGIGGVYRDSRGISYFDLAVRTAAD